MRTPATSEPSRSGLPRAEEALPPDQARRRCVDLEARPFSARVSSRRLWREGDYLEEQRLLAATSGLAPQLAGHSGAGLVCPEVSFIVL